MNAWEARTPPMIDTHLLRNSTDAWDWATEFQKLVDAGVVIDKGLMVGWFANAIMGGRDEGRIEGACEAEEYLLDYDVGGES